LFGVGLNVQTTQTVQHLDGDGSQFLVGGPRSTHAAPRGRFRWQPDPTPPVEILVVLPDGTGLRPLRNVRSWNAGGGTDGWQCVSRGACQQGVDDGAFFDQLLVELARVVPVDARRVFLTGLSNGGAISHRLACERPSVVAAIATVGGTNQYTAAGGRCAARVPVLAIHGSDDPCWGYETGTAACAFLEAAETKGFVVLDACRLEALAVIGDLEFDAAGGLGEPDADRPGLGVLEDVVQGFLDDAVDGRLE
jgi:predicted esterase